MSHDNFLCDLLKLVSNEFSQVWILSEHVDTHGPSQFALLFLCAVTTHSAIVKIHSHILFVQSQTVLGGDTQYMLKAGQLLIWFAIK